MSNEATQRSPEQPVQPVQLEQDLAAQLSPRWAGRSLERLSERQRQSFQRNGFVVVENV